MTRAPNASIENLLATAHSLADLSGKAIRPHFRKPNPVEDKTGTKKGFDPVTAADRAAEKVITREISRKFPDHGIVGEEFGNTRPDAEYKWIIDPIDGTRSFITGSPMWGTLIGLTRADEPILGVIDQPFTGERCWATEKGAYLKRDNSRARKIATRPCPRVSDAFLMTTSPDLFENNTELKRFDRVKDAARMTRYGGDCYAYLLLASGFIDAVIETGLQTYDIAAIVPIVERAGGRITTWDGKSAVHGGRILATGDSRLHSRILTLLNK